MTLRTDPTANGAPSRGLAGDGTAEHALWPAYSLLVEIWKEDVAARHGEVLSDGDRLRLSDPLIRTEPIRFSIAHPTGE